MPAVPSGSNWSFPLRLGFTFWRTPMTLFRRSGCVPTPSRPPSRFSRYHQSRSETIQQPHFQIRQREGIHELARVECRAHPRSRSRRGCQGLAICSLFQDSRFVEEAHRDALELLSLHSTLFPTNLPSAGRLASAVNNIFRWRQTHSYAGAGARASRAAPRQSLSDL